MLSLIICTPDYTGDIAIKENLNSIFQYTLAFKKPGYAVTDSVGRFSAVDIYLFMLTIWLRLSRGHPSMEEFPDVKRIADAFVSRPSVQLIYENWIAEQR